MRTGTSPLVAFFLAVVAGSAGCATARMAVPDDLSASATEFQVTGFSPRIHRQPISIGPYTASLNQDGATFSWGVPLGSASVERSARRVSFVVESPGHSAIEVSCRSRAWSISDGGKHPLSVDATGVAGPLIACLLSQTGEPMRLELSRGGEALRGFAEAPWGAPLQVLSTHRLEGSSLPTGLPTGYSIESNGRAVAAVDLLNEGRVLIHDSLDESKRGYLAAVASALLLTNPEIGD